MKKIKTGHKLEHGQILPIVVIALLVLMGLSALILDGGALMVNRRAAQNAADAGAMAGARVLCREENPTNANIYDAIYQYTTVENNATIVSWERTSENVGVIDELTKGEVVVTAEVEIDSFFAKIFNQNQDTWLSRAELADFLANGDWPERLVEIPLIDGVVVERDTRDECWSLAENLVR